MSVFSVFSGSHFLGRNYEKKNKYNEKQRSYSAEKKDCSRYELIISQTDQDKEIKVILGRRMNRSSEIAQQKVVRMRRQFSLMNSTEESVEGARAKGERKTEEERRQLLPICRGSRLEEYN